MATTIRNITNSKLWLW